MTNKNNWNKNRSSKNRSRPPFKQRRRQRSRQDSGEKSSIEKRYFHLLEQYVAARRKYFDFFHRVQGRKLDRLKNNFYRTLEELRRIEKEYEKDVPREDLTYSNNHQLDPRSLAAEELEIQEIEDFYILQSQKEIDCKEDAEESVGTMEDYLSYKQAGP